jgi:transposase-like protein
MVDFMKPSTIIKMFSQLSHESQIELLNECYSLLYPASAPERVCADIRTSKGYTCPHCSGNAIRHGKTAAGGQRYRCKQCGRTFVITAKTPIGYTKKSGTTWRKYLECFVNQKPLRKSAKDCGISLPTAFLWRHKILDCLEQARKTTSVEGYIQMDETFINISYKGNYHGKIELPRKPRLHGERPNMRGLSREKLCIPCAVDSAGHNVAIVANRGKTSVNALMAAYGNKIVPNSNICSDSEKSYRSLANMTSCCLHAIPSGAISHNGYNIQRVNALHSEIERMRSATRNVASKYLNGYLAYCCWKSGKGNQSTSEQVVSLMQEMFLPNIDTKWETVSCRKAIPVLV